MLENRWGIIGFDHDNAESIINNIEATCGKIIKQRIRGEREMYTLFTDGTFVEWIDPNNYPRAQRFGKIWCNIHINKNVFKQVIMPMYRGKMGDIIWL